MRGAIGHPTTTPPRSADVPLDGWDGSMALALWMRRLKAIRSALHPEQHGPRRPEATVVASVADPLAPCPRSRGPNPIEVVRLPRGVAMRRPTDPSRPAVVLCTLATYGRLLCRGYGVSVARCARSTRGAGQNRQPGLSGEPIRTRRPNSTARTWDIRSRASGAKKAMTVWQATPGRTDRPLTKAYCSLLREGSRPGRLPGVRQHAPPRHARCFVVCRSWSATKPQGCSR